VRLMTVHGAKGLESPIVVLPDTLAPAQPREPRLLMLEGPDGPVAIAAGPAREDSAAAAARAQRTTSAMRRSACACSMWP